MPDEERRCIPSAAPTQVAPDIKQRQRQQFALSRAPEQMAEVRPRQGLDEVCRPAPPSKPAPLPSTLRVAGAVAIGHAADVIVATLEDD